MVKNPIHTKWLCKYHIVFTPYRRKNVYKQIKEDIGEIIKDLCKRKGVEIIEAHMTSNRIFLLMPIPPKYSVSQFMGCPKGKSAITVFDRHSHLKCKFRNRNFWSTGYYVSMLGLHSKS